jgi:hypothetical protein
MYDNRSVIARQTVIYYEQALRLNKDLSKELASDHFFIAQEQLKMVKCQAIVNSLYSEGVSVFYARTGNMCKIV